MSRRTPRRFSAMIRIAERSGSVSIYLDAITGDRTRVRSLGSSCPAARLLSRTKSLCSLILRDFHINIVLPDPGSLTGTVRALPALLEGSPVFSGRAGPGTYTRPGRPPVYQ